MLASSTAMALHGSFTIPREPISQCMLLCMKSYDIKKKNQVSFTTFFCVVTDLNVHTKIG